MQAKRRSTTLVATLALAFMAVGAGSASAAELALFAANSESSDTIEILVVGRGGAVVQVDEEGGPHAGPVKTVVLPPVLPGQFSFALLQANAPNPLDQVTIAGDCNYRERKFVGTVAVPAPLSARSEVLTPSCRKQPPVANPANVAIYGDSIMSQVATPLEDNLPIFVKFDRTLGGGQGLADPAFNFVGKAQARTAAVDPQVSVVLLGGGDGVVGGQGCCGAGWQANYAAVVRNMHAALTSRGGRVVWVLNPMGQGREQLISAVNGVVRAQLTGKQCTSVVDLGLTLSPAGVYTPTINVNGVTTQVRAEDGLHFNITGSRIAAGLVTPAVGALTQGAGANCPAPPPAPKAPTLTAGSPGTVTVSKSRVGTLKKPKVSCAGAGGNCSVTTSLTAKYKVKKKRKTVKIGSSRSTVKAGATGTIKVKLTKAGFKQLKKSRRLKAKLKITVKRSGAKTLTKTVSLTLKAPKR